MNMVTVQNVEGKRLLAEKASQFVLDHHEASTSIVIPQGFHCEKKCHVECIIRERMYRCICLC